ncbi:MAG: hypothetical protein IOD12_12195 [Silvanigrellales bacterium]|nr:hypothetical protein [Silvanigrellales bacterium]
MKTHPLSYRLVARARKDVPLVAATLGLFLVAPSNRSLAQVLELPPPEVEEEADKAPDSKSSQEKGNTPEAGPQAVLEEEESDTKPAAPESATSTGTSTENAPLSAASPEAESPDTGPGAHDKAEESGHSGESRPARPTGLGSGLIWFAAAFVVLVVAIFIFT